MTPRKPKPAPRTRAERMGLTSRARTAQVLVRLSTAEQDSLEAAAAAAGDPLATWIRRVALRAALVPHFDDPRPFAERADVERK